MNIFHWLFGSNSLFAKIFGYYHHTQEPSPVQPPVELPPSPPVQPPPPIVPTYVARHGSVVADHRTFKDDDGYFYPLGATLMWAVRGYKFERDRLEKNLKFLADHKIDYIRILGEVGWKGNEIDPSWPDYDQVLAGVIDLAYDKYGMRTELSVVGGGTNTDYVKLATRVAAIVKVRPNKIMNLECANESFQNLNKPDILKKMLAALKPTGCLIAVSSGNGNPGHDALADDKQFLSWGATLVTAHMDRTFGDGGWRAVRQPWDFKDMGVPVSHNEPIGPLSSVAECHDPLQLAMLRATGIVCGVNAFVIHNGAGVFGQVDPVHHRPANLWEVNNIDNIMNAIRNVDTILTPKVSEGSHFNAFWANSPFTPSDKTQIWSDGYPTGCNRSYLCTNSRGWICVVNGIKKEVKMTPLRSGSIKVFNPITNTSTTLTVEANKPVTLTSQNTDFGAYIVVNA